MKYGRSGGVSRICPAGFSVWLVGAHTVSGIASVDLRSGQTPETSKITRYAVALSAREFPNEASSLCNGTKKGR